MMRKTKDAKNGEVRSVLLELCGKDKDTFNWEKDMLIITKLKDVIPARSSVKTSFSPLDTAHFTKTFPCMIL